MTRHPLEVISGALEEYVWDSYNTCCRHSEEEEPCPEHADEMCPSTELDYAWAWCRAEILKSTGEFIAGGNKNV